MSLMCDVIVEKKIWKTWFDDLEFDRTRKIKVSVDRLVISVVSHSKLFVV